MCQICSAFNPQLLNCEYSGLVPTATGDGPVSVPGDVVDESGDAANNTSTTAAIAVGEFFSGELNANGDSDWIEITLEAGKTYTIAGVGVGALDDALNDIELRLRDASGNLLEGGSGIDDDSGPGANADITVTAATTGTYYIDVQAWNNSDDGTYGVSVTEGEVADFSLEMGAGNLLRPAQGWTTTPGVGETTLTWAFRASGNDPSNNSPLIAMNADQIALTQTAMNYLDAISGLEFNQVNVGGTSNDATMLFGAYSANDFAGAYAYYPGSTPGGITNFSSNAGDVWLNNYYAFPGQSYDFGSYTSFTMLHEIGHAIGLAHPGDYNAGPGQSITYNNSAQFIQDTHQYTVMSYFDETFSGVSSGLGYPDTFMLYDFMAIHELYGADTNYNAGNTIYGFNASEAGSVYDFTTNTTPFMTVYDGQGTDTIDLSAYSMNQWLTLEEGVFSNVGGYVGNFSIAIGAVIEVALGGSGDDTIVGNDADNVLEGNDGADTISGGEGDDTIDGGSGDDLALYSDSFFDHQLSTDDASSLWVVAKGAVTSGDDHLIDIEEVRFADGSFDGTLFTTDDVMDSENAFSWTTYFETYDINANKVSKSIVYDSGLSAQILFSQGQKVSATTTDANDDFSWTYFTDTFSDGLIVGQSRLLDNGLIADTAFENGAKVSTVTTDAGDAFIWASYTDQFDTSGGVVARSITYDNDRIVETQFDDGIRTSSKRVDQIDEFSWETITTGFETDGSIVDRSVKYDTGLEVVTSYEEGKVTSVLNIDGADEFIWSSIDRQYDESGALTVQTNSYDDGRVLVVDYLDGNRSSATMTDIDDVYAWAGYVDTYDVNGSLTERIMTFDDGSQTVWMY